MCSYVVIWFCSNVVSWSWCFFPAAFFAWCVRAAKVTVRPATKATPEERLGPLELVSGTGIAPPFAET